MLPEVGIHLMHADWKKSLRPYCRTIKDICAATLAQTPLAGMEAPWSMAVVLADDAFVRELNRNFRGKDKPTNVLSFPAAESMLKHRRALAAAGQCELGDVVLAYETVEREALEQGKSFRDHARHLLVHGTLHLLGYDHDSAAAAKKMESLEILILGKHGVDNPYL